MTNDESKKPEERQPTVAPTKRVRRKLLAATVGLAFVSMVGAGCSSGNLVSPPRDAGPNTDTADDEDAATER